ncbi:MAG: GGDEF domain-containing protein [Betaproteobacteria bacterium]
MRAALQVFVGSSSGASASLRQAFREALQHLGLTKRDMDLERRREALDGLLARRVPDTQSAQEIRDLLRSWEESGTVGTEPVSPDGSDRPGGARHPGGEAPAALSGPATDGLQELLASTLERGVAPRLDRYTDLSSEVLRVADRARRASVHENWFQFGQQLKRFWIKVEMRVEPDRELMDHLLRLLGLVVDNLDELVEDDQWMKGQVRVLRDLIDQPLDLGTVREAERGFREVIYKQSRLKTSLVEAKSTLKSLLTVFIERLATVTGATEEYHKKIGHYAERILSTESIDSLKMIVEDLMTDTRGMQVDMMRSRDDLVSARREAEEASQRVRQLESELELVSEKVREDELTGTLNRRGLDDALAREISRAQRNGKPVALALLDLDDFKRVNDTYGHAAGDAALVHLARIIRRTMRPTDVVARLGGEEFVIVLPETTLDKAVLTVKRLQRELTKRIFLSGKERVLMTFSAGATCYQPPEEAEHFLARADRAMYRAKQQGKNQVVAAE